MEALSADHPITGKSETRCFARTGTFRVFTSGYAISGLLLDVIFCVTTVVLQALLVQRMKNSVLWTTEGIYICRVAGSTIVFASNEYIYFTNMYTQ